MNAHPTPSCRLESHLISLVVVDIGYQEPGYWNDLAPFLTIRRRDHSELFDRRSHHGTGRQQVLHILQ